MLYLYTAQEEVLYLYTAPEEVLYLYTAQEEVLYLYTAPEEVLYLYTAPEEVLYLYTAPVEVLYIYTAPEEVLYLYTRGGFLVLQEGLEVHEGPGMPGLVGGSVVLSSSVVVLQNGSYGGPYAGDTPSPLLQLQPPVSQLLVAAARLHHHYISVSSY